MRVRLRRAGARRVPRATRAGFTLIELMVVIVLISVLALLATPMMRTTKDDRLTFDYGRQLSQLYHRATIRAMAKGGAHMVIFEKVSGAARGRALLFEAHDADGSFSKSCNGTNQWLGANETWAIGTSLTNAYIIDGVDMNTVGVVVDANIFGTARFGATANVAAIAYCVTPGGTAYAGSGSTGALAIAAMQAAPPFSDTFEVNVQRHLVGTSTGVGLGRHVLVASGAAPRIISQ